METIVLNDTFRDYTGLCKVTHDLCERKKYHRVCRVAQLNFMKTNASVTLFMLLILFSAAYAVGDQYGTTPKGAIFNDGSPNETRSNGAITNDTCSNVTRLNGTVYYINKSDAQVVQPVNGTRFNLTLPVKSEITLFDSWGNEVPIELDEQFRRGVYRYKITSNTSIEGYLNYTLPVQDQRFSTVPISGMPAKVVIPPGYTTGDHLLGKPRPKPDEVTKDDGRTVLIWQDPKRMIDVGYYKESAPRAFRLFLLMLAFLAAVLTLGHVASMKRLRSMKEDVDKDFNGHNRDQ